MLKENKRLSLTLKQRAFLREYFKTGNATQSALKVYDTSDYSSAGAIASQNLKKLKDPIRLMMEAKGLSIGKLVDVIIEGLGATKAQSFNKEAPDFSTRHKYLETASGWLGLEQEPQSPPWLTQINVGGDKVIRVFYPNFLPPAPEEESE